MFIGCPQITIAIRVTKSVSAFAFLVKNDIDFSEFQTLMIINLVQGYIKWVESFQSMVTNCTCMPPKLNIGRRCCSSKEHFVRTAMVSSMFISIQ